ncbi:MAG: hypothetical protein DK305_000024 [Chloroflexi bacterium]|jgi:hypothetical protein|nr:MAG: hypothetical protein DK305_000024 [Chloroflexota bacterium]
MTSDGFSNKLPQEKNNQLQYFAPCNRKKNCIGSSFSFGY